MSPLLHSPNFGDLWLRMLVRLEAWQARGVRIFYQTQTRPLDLTFRLSRACIILSKALTWSQILGRSVPERIAAFSDTALRPQLDHDEHAP
jgi:hypothetical protein